MRNLFFFSHVYFVAQSCVLRNSTQGVNLANNLVAEPDVG
jgi:uncharacterized membrane protein (UPF0136 family)